MYMELSLGMLGGESSEKHDPHMVLDRQGDYPESTRQKEKSASYQQSILA